MDELLELLRADPPLADPDRTARTMRAARWQVKARRALGGGHGFLAAFAQSLATLLRLRGDHERR
ncbi:MAG: hypothetical protein KDC33_05530 [Thermoleophilia bacterium]|nr:hypothetical protein [Thermoleophilia bacterium]